MQEDNPKWRKFDVVELIEKHLGKPTAKLHKASKQTLIDILHHLERGKIIEGTGLTTWGSSPDDICTTCGEQRHRHRPGKIEFHDFTNAPKLSAVCRRGDNYCIEAGRCVSTIQGRYCPEVTE